MEAELLKKRLLELAKRSESSMIYTFSPFLGLAEQAAFDEIRSSLAGIRYTAFGGAEGAERVMIRFGDAEELGYELPFPIATLKCEPLSQKFADRLTHRDILGALMNLGIERTVLGDIVIHDNVAYIFAHEDIADFIITSLGRVKHTDVKLSIASELPTDTLFRTERRRIQVASERLDAVIAKLFSLSRDEAQSLFAKKLVFVSGRQTENRAYVPKRGDVVSVRGKGRFIYLSFDSLSRKGKFNVEVELYV